MHLKTSPIQSICPLVHPYIGLFDDSFNDEIDRFSCYRVGQIVEEYNPAQEKYKNMLHLVAYDIRDPKRLRYVAKTCEDFGMRVEYSVFECDLSEKNFQNFWNILADLIDADEDRILAYRICGSCVTHIESMGAISRPGKPLLYIL